MLQHKLTKSATHYFEVFQCGFGQQMNKINTLYPTAITEPQQNPLRDTYTNFVRKLDDRIKHTMTLRKTECLKQSNKLLDQLNDIKKRSGKYKKKIYQQQKQFEEKVQNIIRYDIRKYEEYQMFFKVQFDHLQNTIDQLRKNNAKYRAKIEEKTHQLKQLKRQNTVLQLTSKNNTERVMSTLQSTVRLSYSNSNSKRMKTDSSLPVLRPSNRYQRIKTLESEYSETPIPMQKARKRAASYMQPIGAIRSKQKSQLIFLGQLFQWYKSQSDPDSNWFLKVLFNKRHYQRIKDFISKHSGDRTVFHHK